MLHQFLSYVHVKATPSRARWSSIAALGFSLGVMPVTAAAQAAPQTQAQLDSIKQRLEDAEAALQALREQLAAESQTALRTRSRVSLEFHGRALMNVIRNSRRTNNVDVPTIVVPQAGPGSQHGLAMTIRQTMLGLAFTVNEVAGGTFMGDIDADFFGGQQPSSGGRTFPLVRLRTARGALEWSKGYVMVGQEQPLIANLDPVSLASVGTPGFAGSGNLWLWLPQLRGGVHTTGRVRFGVEAAVLAPTSGDPNGLFDTQFDPAERTGTPYLQGQVRLDWGESDRPGLVTVGYHTGKLRNPDDSTRTSWAVGGMVRIPIGRTLELRGEYFDGEALRGLGGGGIGQGIEGGEPVHTSGGWMQLNWQATPRFLLGAGTGWDDPIDWDVGTRFLNETTEAHAHWRPAGPLVLGLEWRRTTTTYMPVTGPITNHHLNLAFGFEF